MSRTQLKTAAFWVATIFGPTSFVIGGVIGLMGSPEAVEGLHHLGYPAYFGVLLGAWKLAGINFGVDSPWSLSETGPGFDGSIFDAGGLYVGDGQNHWQFIPDQLQDIPGASYSTRIASNLSWIRSIVGTGSSPDVPEPATAGLMTVAGMALALRRRRHPVI